MRLDPRAPLVLDTRELGRRPGSQRRRSFTAPAPADLGIEVLRVPEGSPIEFELRLEAVMEGVLVTGQAQAGLEGECARCLEEIRDDVVADFQELFVYEESDTATDGEDEDDQPVGGRPARPRTTAAGRGGARRCRSSRCARTTVRACAPSAVHGSQTTPATSTTSRSTPGGRRCKGSTSWRTTSTKTDQSTPAHVERPDCDRRRG